MRIRHRQVFQKVRLRGLKAVQLSASSVRWRPGCSGSQSVSHLLQAGADGRPVPVHLFGEPAQEKEVRHAAGLFGKPVRLAHVARRRVFTTRCPPG